LSAPNSVDVSAANASDNVHQYTGVNAGWWEYTTNVFVPTAYTGDTYFILMNQYGNAGPFNWSIEYKINGTNNTFSDDYTNGTAVPSGGNTRVGVNAALIRGAWTQIRVDFDLTNNYMQAFYNGAAISNGSWKTSATSTLTLAAVDLFADTGTSVFYDNASLRQIPAPSGLALLGLGGLLIPDRLFIFTLLTPDFGRGFFVGVAELATPLQAALGWDGDMPFADTYLPSQPKPRLDSGAEPPRPTSEVLRVYIPPIHHPVRERLERRVPRSGIPAVSV
jgi:hypothetical protein